MIARNARNLRIGDRLAPLAAVFLVLTACDNDNSDTTGSILEVWAHAGQESERSVLIDQVAQFNAREADVEVRLTLIPEGSYNAQVQAAAVAGGLPDLLELDGPFLYAYVWQGRLQPLDRLLPEGLRADLLPSIIEQGRYHDRLWAFGTFDSGLGLYADRVQLEQADIRIPDLNTPWDAAEFEDILERLATRDADGQVLDLKLNYAGEWYTYGFSPLIQSAGGGLIDRSDVARAEGVLDGPSSIGAMRRIQSWILRGRVDPNIDDAAFATRRVALALGGHWNYPRYSGRLGEDLLLLPLPDLGHGPKTGQGSWCWAVTADSTQPDGAARFLAFLLEPDQILAMTAANGAVPATRRAIARSPLYRPGGPLDLFVEQLDGGYAVPRPPTPAYPVITAEFQKAFDRIRSGGEVQAALQRAARVIDLEIEDNQGYPLVGRAREETIR
ncbi:sugar ABC transporter substrate-binding protein [Thiocapsa bogorovii]|uniref:sugar ABC transporter substrate-binding protein n=1 Tax=Thiocapsa bogorovii TaxID=521689 RepID=UPI001E41161F|nr:ABC transporter substrate-binding protein [Thiocapsa bogorovii]UHD18582.1 ABC transporter substrate-binding protein [Thiocapsa bogorovii]